MDIEEAIRELKGYLTWLEANGFLKLAKDSAIETLLTAYEKEKEKNSKLLEALDTVNHEKGVFIESYEKEKEKNKNLEQENSFLKMMYRGTDEFKAIEKLAGGGIKQC